MLTAPARYRFGRQLLGQLLFADGARFCHDIRHGLTPRLNQWMAGARLQGSQGSSQRLMLATQVRPVWSRTLTSWQASAFDFLGDGSLQVVDVISITSCASFDRQSSLVLRA